MKLEIFLVLLVLALLIMAFKKRSLDRDWKEHVE